VGLYSASRPGHLTPGKKTRGIPLTGGWVGLRAGLCVEKIKLPAPAGNQIRFLGSPNRTVFPMLTELPRITH